MGNLVRARHHIAAIVFDQIGAADSDKTDREKKKTDGKHKAGHSKIFKKDAFHLLLPQAKTAGRFLA